VTGAPTVATAEHGAALIAEIGTALAQLIERARVEVPPLVWTRTTTAFAG
jgi:creatinine amidohydrolase